MTATTDGTFGIAGMEDETHKEKMEFYKKHEVLIESFTQAAADLALNGKTEDFRRLIECVNHVLMDCMTILTDVNQKGGASVFLDDE